MLYASEEFPELTALIERKRQPGDVARAVDLVSQSRGLQRAKELATFHAQAAVDAASVFPEGEARDGLIALCHIALALVVSARIVSHSLSFRIHGARAQRTHAQRSAADATASRWRHSSMQSASLIAPDAIASVKRSARAFAQRAASDRRVE